MKTVTWNSLDAQNYNAVDGTDAGSVAGDTAGEGWDAAGGSNANQLTELFLGAAGSTLAPNATLNLGNAYNTSIFGNTDGDLIFKFGVLNGAALITAPVTYVSTGVPGDYNGNGIVDAADYTVWRDSLGKTGAGLAADGDGNNAVDQADYTYWKTRFGNTSGSGAGQAGSVPEPTSLVLALTALVLLAQMRRMIADTKTSRRKGACGRPDGSCRPAAPPCDRWRVTRGLICRIRGEIGRP